MRQHDFRESLALSHELANAPWWEQVYRQAFAGFQAMCSVRADGWAQRAGIDRLVILESGRIVSIDEKVRTQAFGDVLLEQWSDRDRRIPGWVAKDLACDFIAYAVLPSAVCFLLPFLPLRAAWRAHGARWAAQYGTVSARNHRYTTESVPVPVEVLYQSIVARGLRFEWTPTGEELRLLGPEAILQQGVRRGRPLTWDDFSRREATD